MDIFLIKKNVNWKFWKFQKQILKYQVLKDFFEFSKFYVLEFFKFSNFKIKL